MLARLKAPYLTRQATPPVPLHEVQPVAEFYACAPPSYSEDTAV